MRDNVWALRESKLWGELALGFNVRFRAWELGGCGGVREVSAVRRSVI